MTSNQPTTDAAEHERRVTDFLLEVDQCLRGCSSKHLWLSGEGRAEMESLMRSRPQTADGDLVERAGNIVAVLETRPDHATRLKAIQACEDLTRDLAKCEPRPAPEVPEEWLDWARRTVAACEEECSTYPGVQEDEEIARSILAVRAKAEVQDQATYDAMVRARDIAVDMARDADLQHERIRDNYRRLRSVLGCVEGDDLFDSLNDLSDWVAHRQAIANVVGCEPLFRKIHDECERLVATVRTKAIESAAGERQREAVPSMSMLTRDLRQCESANRTLQAQIDDYDRRLREAVQAPASGRLVALAEWASEQLHHFTPDGDDAEFDRQLNSFREAIAAEREREPKPGQPDGWIASFLHDEVREERAEWKAKAEKAEAELADVKRREATGVELLDGIIADLRAKLEKAEQNSGDAKLRELRQFIERQRDHPTVGVQRTAMERALCGDAIAKIDRLLSESPQPEPEAPSEPVPFDDGPLDRWMQEYQQETRSGRFITRQEHALAELAKRELARQSAKGAK